MREYERTLRRPRFLAVVVLAMITAGCGSGGNNDQGIAFTATGIWRGLETIEDDTIRCIEPNVSSAVIDTSYTVSVANVTEFPDRFNPFADPCGGFIGLENNLTQLAMNLQRVEIRYEVPSAAVTVPGHSVAAGVRIPSASSTTEATSGQSNLVYLELVGQMLSQTTMAFLEIHSSELPQRPYVMKAYLVAVGQSQNGDQYRTNETGYTFTIED